MVAVRTISISRRGENKCNKRDVNVVVRVVPTAATGRRSRRSPMAGRIAHAQDDITPYPSNSGSMGSREMDFVSKCGEILATYGVFQLP